MDKQVISRVCQCCHRHIEDPNKKWDKKGLSTHGMCYKCLKGAYLHGYDEWIEMTKEERK